jgi:hypothetical protein
MLTKFVLVKLLIQRGEDRKMFQFVFPEMSFHPQQRAGIFASSTYTTTTRSIVVCHDCLFSLLLVRPCFIRNPQPVQFKYNQKRTGVSSQPVPAQYKPNVAQRHDEFDPIGVRSAACSTLKGAT